MSKIKNYLPVNPSQIHELGAICYLSGTLDKVFNANGNHVSIMHHVAVSYEDAAGRVHASVIGQLACVIKGVERAVPGSRIRVVAELVRDDANIDFRGMLYDALQPAFDIDPACRIDRRLAGAYN